MKGGDFINNQIREWYKNNIKYAEDIEKMTDYYMYINSITPTIVRKITPEEEILYESHMNKYAVNTRVKYQKGEKYERSNEDKIVDHKRC